MLSPDVTCIYLTSSGYIEQAKKSFLSLQFHQNSKTQSVPGLQTVFRADYVLPTPPFIGFGYNGKLWFGANLEAPYVVG